MKEVITTVYMENGRTHRSILAVPGGKVARILVTAFTDDDPMSKIVLEREGDIE